jgi:hypothetical protein
MKQPCYNPKLELSEIKCKKYEGIIPSKIPKNYPKNRWFKEEGDIQFSLYKNNIIIHIFYRTRLEEIEVIMLNRITKQIYEKYWDCSLKTQIASQWIYTEKGKRVIRKFKRLANQIMKEEIN